MPWVSKVLHATRSSTEHFAVTHDSHVGWQLVIAIVASVVLAFPVYGIVGLAVRSTAGYLPGRQLRCSCKVIRACVAARTASGRSICCRHAVRSHSLQLCALYGYPASNS